jgi:glycosyltransferase involved in cell wall biosynthesis
MAPLVIERARAPAILWLVDSIGRELSGTARSAPLWQRPLIRWERHRVDRATRELAPRFAETWVASEDDRDDLVRIGCERVEVVPIGLDDGLFELPLVEARNARVGFVGNLAVKHNVDAALLLTREIFPLIRVRCPSATLTIAGANPGADLQALCRRRGVELLGAQPSLLPWWGSVGALVAPLRFSAGVQYKVLEAMAAGVPTVTTPRVAAGLRAESGKHLLTATTNAEFAECAAQCLSGGAATFERMRQARDFVRDRFNWSVAISRMSAVASSGGVTRRS